MPMWLAIVLIIVAIAASLAVGVYLGIQRRKQVAEKAIGQLRLRRRNFYWKVKMNFIV